MASYDLDAVETRLLGCLLEKERTTPENYPLSLNSLMTACNQSTNRDPVVAFDEKTVEAGLYSLRQKKFAVSISQGGSRVQKYRHTLMDHYALEPREVALLCVLMLRGAQTPGELRARTERLCGLVSLEEIETTLEGMTRGESPLIRALVARPGQKERRFVQLLSDDELVAEAAAAQSQTREDAQRPTPAYELLGSEVAALRAELQALREEFAAFRKQFE